MAKRQRILSSQRKPKGGEGEQEAVSMDSLQSEVEALEGLVDDWERDWFDSSIAWEVGARDLQRRLTTATAGSAPSISTRSLGGGDLGHGGEDRACPCPYCSSQDPSRAAWALLARAEWAYGALAEIRGEAGWAKEAASNYRASLQAWGDQAVANLSLGALLWRVRGLTDEGSAALARAAKWAGRGKASCPAQGAMGGAAVHLQAVQSLAAGDLPRLRVVLGSASPRLNYTLSPLLFSEGPTPSRIAARDATALPADCPVAVCDDALPPPLFDRIAAAFRWSRSPDGFWQHHRRSHPGTPYHSYAFRLGPSPPANALEAAAAALLPELARRWPKAFGAKAAVVEWWVHARHPRDGHQLHWDLDELRASAGHGLSHPLLSTVLFLTGGGGGATVVTGQRLGEGGGCPAGPALRSWAVSPRRNRLLVFLGGLLHGVLPAPQTPGAADEPPPSGAADDPPTRVTLMMAWHSAAASSAPPLSPPPPLGPMRRLDAGAPWARGLLLPPSLQDQSRSSERQGSNDGEKEEGGSESPSPCPNMCWWVPPPVTPAWVPIDNSTGSDTAGRGREANDGADREGAEAQAAVPEGLRYFVHSLGDFDNLYLKGGASEAPRY